MASASQLPVARLAGTPKGCTLRVNPPALPSAASSARSPAPSASGSVAPRMYERALELARAQEYERAASVFERVVTVAPDFAKGWISWAQLEKRVARASQADPRRAVAILQVAASQLQQARASAAAGGGGSTSSSSSSSSSSSGGSSAGTSSSAAVLQAWALLELQRGNARAATNLLARAVAADPARCSPVLRWAPVRAAAAEVQGSRRGGGGGSEAPLSSS